MASNSRITQGNVGIGVTGNLIASGSGTTISRTLDLDTGQTANLSGGATVHATVQSAGENAILTNAVTAAALAYADAKNDTATMTVAGNAITSSQTINVGAGLNVLDLTSLTLTTGGNLVLNGTSTSATQLVINVTGAFTVINAATITETGTLSQYNVLINVVGTGTAVCITGGSSNTCNSGNSATLATVDAIILSPERTVSLDSGIVEGEVIVGDTTGGTGLTLTNHSVVDAPEPATLLLVSSGLASFYLRRRRQKAS